MKTHVLFSRGDHRWLVLGRDPERPANVADTNQVVIVLGDSAALVDPGGIEVFPSFLAALTESVSVEKVDNILVTSPDPDAVSSLPLWRQVCKSAVKVQAPALWSDLVAHLDADCEISTIGDDGNFVELASGLRLDVVPSPYLHAPGAFGVYDPEAKVLYSGSIASAPNTANATGEFVVNDFDSHVAFLETYHARWFASERARDAWIDKVSGMDIDILVPHRGPAMQGDDVERFIDWFSSLPIGDVLPAASVVQPSAPPQPEPDRVSEPAPSDDGLLSESAEDALAELMGIDTSVAPTGKPEPGGEFRLVTRSDFDGLVCAVLFEELEMIDDILFVHPNDMQEGRVPITDQDITTNLPYVPGCHLAFDHHLSEVARVGKKHDNHIINPDAPSAARVVYEYYGARVGFPDISEEMMAAVDQGDSAQYTMDDVLEPKRWALLNFIMDSRTGLGRFRGFRIPNYELMMSLIEYCREYTIDEILELPDVKERVDLYLEQQSLFKDQIERCTSVHDNLVVLNLLEEETVYVGNRFMIYALFPQCNISMHVMWGRDKQNVVFAVGKSIFDRGSNTKVGDLMLQYGGGGHNAAGTCQSDPLLADTVKQALIQKIVEDG